MKHNIENKIIAKLLIITCMVIFLTCLYNHTQRQVVAENLSDSGISTVCTRVVDGDTIVISGGDKVRLIGIDTPELHESAKLDKDSARIGKDKKTIQALGKQASDYAKRVLEGKQIRLEYDPNNKHIDNRDKYGRLLAYIYLKDGTFFNAKIIKDGYANAYTKFPFKYMDEFRAYEREARENNRGLWAGKDFQEGSGTEIKATLPQRASPEGQYVGSVKSEVFHRESCSIVSKIKPSNLIVYGSREEAIKFGKRPCAVCKP